MGAELVFQCLVSWPSNGMRLVPVLRQGVVIEARKAICILTEAQLYLFFFIIKLYSHKRRNTIVDCYLSLLI